MKNLFARLYLLLLLTFVGFGWSVDQLYNQFANEQQVVTDLDLHRGTLYLLNHELARLPVESQQEYIRVLSPSFGYPVALVNETELLNTLAQNAQTLTEQQKQFLRQGGQVSVIDDKTGLSWFLQAYNNSNNIILLGPIKQETSAANTLFSAVFLLILALIVFIWVWPLSRGLVTLTSAAQRFGEGDFSTRVTMEIARPLLPVAQRFNDMAGRIQRLIRSHKELSHAVSHELRTPIARIRFAMEMTRELSDAEKREVYFAAMDSNIEELDGLVDELLTYARFDRDEPKLDFLPVHLLPLVQEVVAKFEMLESHIEFNIDCQHGSSVEAQCDREGINRVLDNLLRNAIRYAKSAIRIRIDSRDKDVEIWVEDDGPGIPQENWQSLFDPFVRLDNSRDRSSGGIGLGLAIVRRYMEWHHGTVRVENAEPQGARFILNWPLHRNQHKY